MTLPYQPCPNILKVALSGNVGGEELVNTLHYGRPTAWDTTDMLTVATGVYDWWVANMAPLVCDNSGFNLSQATDLTTRTSASVTYSHALTGGTISTPAAPNNVAVCVTLRTDNRGRSYRGRNYVGGIPLSQILGGLYIESTYANEIKEAYEALIGEDFGVGAVWGVLSRTLDKVLRDEGVLTEITSVSVDLALDSQRRRLAGRGR